MNILFISDDNLLKSVVYDIHMLAEGLSLLGHRVYVIGSQRGSHTRLRTEERNMARVYPEAKVHLFNVGIINVPIITYPFRIFSSYRQIRKVIMKRNIDVIVLYSVIFTGLPAVSLSKKFNIPLVFRNIDMLHRLMPTLIKQKVVKSLEKMIYPETDKILTLTPNYAEYLINFGAVKSRLKMLPFPVDIDLFHRSTDSSEVRQKWKLDKRDQIIVFIGNLYKFSGLTDFIYQFPEVIKQIPKAKLLIVGDGELRAKLERIISKLGVKEHIVITGLQPFKTMPQYINLADICINPFPVSGYMKDLFCAKVIQYLACGKAVVSSSLPGMTTMLPGESCGIVYVDNAINMAREIVSLLKSPEKREQLGQAGFNYVRQAHSRDKMIIQLEEYLVETVHENKIAMSKKINLLDKTE
jgi:glycosyltransferase involved in cell wall biosynthesis